MIAELLRRHSFNFACERDLQEGIEQVLKSAEIPYLREHRLSPADRPDFFCEGIAIEVKVTGSRVKVMQQLCRYAEFSCVTGLILVTAKASIVPAASILGKPIERVLVRRLA